MPLEFKKGNIFDQDVEVLVNPVNCVGVMGAGLALQFKKRFPAMFKAYKSDCECGYVKCGSMWVTSSTPGICNFPTKNHWKDPSKLEWIETGLKTLRIAIGDRGIKSIAIPPLGCGLGGLKWPDVKALIIKHLSNIDECLIVVLEPSGGQFSKKGPNDNKKQD